MRLKNVLSEGEATTIAEEIEFFDGSDELFLLFAHELEQAVLAKLAEQKPEFWVRFVFDGEGWEPPVHQSGMTSEMIKSGRYTPLYAQPPMPADHFPDLGKMVVQRKKPVAWRVHPFNYGAGVNGAYAITQQENQMQAWINKGWEITPLYLAPSLSLEPSDELIAEIKAMAEIRLVNGKSLTREQLQLNWLRQSGIPFFENARGRPIIARAVIEGAQTRPPIQQKNVQN